MGPDAERTTGSNRKRSGVGIILLAVLVTGCGDQRATPGASSGAVSQVPTTPIAEATTDPDFPVHPQFVEHFTGEVYTDLNGSYVPFGSEEGQTMLWMWSERAAELSPSSTVRDLLADEGDDPGAVDDVLSDVSIAGSADAGHAAVDRATTVLGAGFTLLRLTGQIDAEGEQVTLEALDTLEDYYGVQPELDQMRDDLLTFTGPSSP